MACSNPSCAQTTCRSRGTLSKQLLAVLSLGTALSGCIAGNDSAPPVLAVQLLWDEAPDKGFSAGTCDSAQVAHMSWQLKEGDQIVGQSDDPNVPCEDGFNFVDVGPGKYDLSIQGFDADLKPLWSSSCTGLVLERFDLLYSCKVLQPATP
jgi:hypothetical protein